MCNRILIVEDDEVQVYFLKKAIGKYFNVDIENIDNTNDALKMLDLFVFCLVITDISLPGKSGHEIVSKCLENKIPVIVITAYLPNMTFIDERVRACIHKPIDLDQLMETMKGIIKIQDLKEIEYA